MCLSLTELPLQIGRSVHSLDFNSHFLLFTCTFVFCSNVYSEAAYLSVLAVMVCLWLCALFVQVLYALTLPDVGPHQ